MPWYKGCNLANWATIADASALAVAGHSDFATFVDITGFCGGARDKLSPSNWEPSPNEAALKFRPNGTSPFHVDDLHLNNRGYCAIFTQPVIQNVLGCQPATYDCAPVTTDIPCAPGQPAYKDMEGCGVLQKADQYGEKAEQALTNRFSYYPKDVLGNPIFTRLMANATNRISATWSTSPAAAKDEETTEPLRGGAKRWRLLRARGDRSLRAR